MSIQFKASTSPEFHRRRAEVEMEKALAAAKPSIAALHLELARLHRERRNQLADQVQTFPNRPPPIHRADKES